MAPPWTLPPPGMPKASFADRESWERVRFATDVQNGAAAVVPNNPAVGDRQPGDGDRRPTADGEDAAGVVAAYGQLVGPRAVDVEVLADRQLAAGERDGLALKAVVEDDLVSALRLRDHRP